MLQENIRQMSTSSPILAENSNITADALIQNAYQETKLKTTGGDTNLSESV